MKSVAKIINGYQLYQFWVAVSATIPMICDGMQYSWSSPVMPKLRLEDSPIKITPEDETWLEAMYLISALAGLPITPLIVDRIGRKKSILLAAGTSLLAWILLGVATNKIYLYVARFIAGTMSDLIFVIVPMYVAEIADPDIRGFLTGLVYVMMISGVIIMYSVAPFVPIFVPSIIGSLLIVLHVITFSFMPQSPYFLIQSGKFELAEQSLKKLRGERHCEIIAKEISNTLREKNQKKCGLSKSINNKSTYRALAYVTLLNTAQHFCAFSVVLMNLHTILEKAHSVYFDRNLTGIVIAVVQLISVIVSSFTVDKFGRKILLFFSSLLTGFSLLGLGIYLHLQSLQINVESVSWVPILLIIVYAAAFNVGLGVIPKVMASELFSNEFKAIGMSYGDAIYVIMAFLSILLYNNLVHYYEMFYVFYIFGFISFVVVVLSSLFVPETKGKSLEEIQQILKM